MSFADSILALDAAQVPNLATCRGIVAELLEGLGNRIVGQDQMIRRVVQAFLLNHHALIESLPGLAKTSLVRTVAESLGVRFKRIQYVPDMLPSDLYGRNVLHMQGGVSQLKWVYGPIFNAFVVADEINRASPKVQAATLECMQERTCTLIDRRFPLTVYHPAYRQYLKGHHKTLTVFGLPCPHPDDNGRVLFVVCATQNPIEMEGTYPLAEAQIDRFLFKIQVMPPAMDYYDRIVQRNLPTSPVPNLLENYADEDETDWRNPGAGPGDADFRSGEDGVPLWLKTLCFREVVFHRIITDPSGLHGQLLTSPRKRGLWDRVRLFLFLAHYRAAERDPGLSADSGVLPAPLRGEFQEYMRSFLALWNEGAPPSAPSGAGGGDVAAAVRGEVSRLLTSGIFQYVESGPSPRALIDWPRAAAAEAFLSNDTEIRRKHLRDVAEDVLRHHIRLSPQARAEGLSSQDLIGLLINRLLPAVDAPTEELEDQAPLLP